MPINSQFHFGASTRTYIIRERPQSTSAFGPRPIMDQLERESDHASSLLGLPETDLELDVRVKYIICIDYVFNFCVHNYSLEFD